MKEKALKQQAKIKMEAEILIKRGGVRDFRGDFLDPQVAHLDEQQQKDYLRDPTSVKLKKYA